eukprot:g8571.t1
MNDEVGDAKQGISREGPLRSIESPPFARPLAHHQTENNGGLTTYPGAAAPTTKTSPPPAALPPDFGTQALQQGTPQQPLFPSGISGPVAPPPSSPGLGGSSSGGDASSQFLLRPDGMQMERDTPPIPPPPATDQQSESSTRFDFSGNATAGAQTLPPPLGPEPMGAAGRGWGGDSAPEASRVGGRDELSGEKDPPSSKAPPMPALPPPPPPTYDGVSFQPQQQQQRAPAPPLPAALGGLAGLALPLPPPPRPLQHQQRGGPAPAAAYTPAIPTPPQEKSLDVLVAEFLASGAPPPPEPVSETLALGDPSGWVAALGQLARRRAWRKLVEIAGTMLVAHRGGGAPGLTAEQAMDLRLRRAVGMLKLGRAADAAEAAAEAGQEAGQPPLAAVTVAARVAAAGAKSLCEGEAEEEALDELTALKHELEGVIASSSSPAESGVGSDAEEAAAQTSASLTLTVAEAVAWRRRVMSSLVNSFVGRGNWRLALALLEEMGKEQCSTAALATTGGAAQPQPPLPAVTDDTLRVEVLSRIGRVFLQFGSLVDAEVYFRRAEEAAAAEGAGEDNPRVLVNRGLLNFSQNEFVAAQENFRSAATVAAKAEPPDDTDDGWLWATLDQGAGLMDSAVNNLSLAMVYSCDVMRGVDTLEGLIRKDPRLYMLDVVIFNLCTLYDLSFDAVASSKKKRTLQAVAQRFRLEDIDASSFRMS